MAEFKRLSDVEVVAEPTESANVLIEENGVIKKAPKTSIGGTGVSSWNDLTDKPFGEAENVVYSFIGTVGVDSSDINETKITFQLNDYAYNVIKEGKEYVVVLNGVEYPVIAQYDGILYDYVGNLSYQWGYSDDTGESFLFASNYLMIDASYSGEINFEVKETTVSQLDEKFIPSSIARTKNIPIPFSGSWNDLTDKPFYEEYPIIHQGTYTLTYQEDPVNYEYYYMCNISDYFNTTGGKEYIVTVNGVSRKVMCIQGDLPGVNGVSYSSGKIKMTPPDEHAELGYPGITVDYMVQDAENGTPVPLDAKYLPKAIAVADATGETPTAAEFNALLAALRNAGYLAT